VIKRNNKTGEREPVLTCKTYKTNSYAQRVTVFDDNGGIVGVFRYEPDNPLPCGAHVWFETQNKIECK
jgi:hypothetical protein